MKKYLLSAIIILLSLSVHAQKDQTIFGGNGIRLTGIWGGSTAMVNGIDEDFDIYGGGYFTFELNKALLIGWSNHQVRSTLNDVGLVELESNEFLLGYSPNSYRAFHPYFYTSIGTGTASLENEGEDRILNVQPSVALELNVLRWFRISAEGGYRFISGSDFASVSDRRLSSPYVGLRLKFGWSWGR